MLKAYISICYKTAFFHWVLLLSFARICCQREKLEEEISSIQLKSFFQTHINSHKFINPFRRDRKWFEDVNLEFGTFFRNLMRCEWRFLDVKNKRGNLMYWYVTYVYHPYCLKHIFIQIFSLPSSSYTTHTTLQLTKKWKALVAQHPQIPINP